MGVRFPLPAPSILISFNDLRGIGSASQIVSGTVRILPVFNKLWMLQAQSPIATYM